MSAGQHSVKPNLAHLLESVDKDIFYALKRTQHVTTYGGIALADAVKAKFPDVNTKELNRLIAKATFSSDAFAKLNVHQHGSLELGSKWIMFRSDPLREVKTSPFDQLNPLKSRDKNVAAAADSGLKPVQKNGGKSSDYGDSPPGGGQVEPRSHEASDAKGDQQLQSTIQVPESDTQDVKKVSAGADSHIEEKALLSHLNFMLLCLQTVHEL